METEEKTLKPEESLQIIDQMIQKAKANLHDSSFYFLLWGWIILVVVVGQSLLQHFTNFEKPYLVWLLIIFGIMASAIYGIRSGKKSKVMSHLDRLNFLNWMIFLGSYFIIIIFMKDFNYKISPIIFLLAGNATLMTGFLIKFRPLIIGGLVFWAGIFCQFLLPHQILEFVFPLVIIFGYLVPGYMLKFQHKKNA
jgi:hypothetical protein